MDIFMLITEEYIFCAQHLLAGTEDQITQENFEKVRSSLV